MRVAIVSTMLHPGELLLPFIRYHASIGIAHLFLYFDDPADPGIAVARACANVTAIACDDELRERQWRTSKQPDVVSARAASHADDRVMARQCLGVESAMELARGLGIDWLVHLDIDELLDPGAGSLQQQLAALDRLGAEEARFHNLEAVPERVEIADVFADSTLFVVNPATYDDEQRRAFDAATRRRYFTAYSNGKAAARVSADLLPRGVHAFDGRRVVQVDLPVVLHYPALGFRRFWDKYARRGDFPDHFSDGSPVAEFERRARDLRKTGDVAAGERFYRDHVVLADPGLVEELLAARLLVRLDGPARAIAALSDSPS